MLTSILGRTVIDNTGLKGVYTVDLTWAADDQPSGPSLFTAVQEQLGLKLEARTGPIETLVVDSADKPTVDGAEVSPAVGAMPVAQYAATEKLRFDVASVRRDKSARKPSSNVPLGPGGVSRPSGGILNAQNFGLLYYQIGRASCR